MASPITARWVLIGDVLGRTPLASVSQNALAVALGAGSTRAESRPSREAAPGEHEADRQEPGPADRGGAQRRPHEAALACCTGRISLAIISPNGPALRTAFRPGRSWP